MFGDDSVAKITFFFYITGPRGRLSFFFEKVGRLYFSNIVWDIIPKLCTDVRETLF